MIYDPLVPLELKDIQTWFSGVIRQKMIQHQQDRIDFDEVNTYIAETDELSAPFRMQLYNESYWLRLLEVLRADFPLVVRLFGSDEFDRIIGVPYLEFAPPRHWSLNNICDRFMAWVTQYYEAQDKKLVMICAQLDIWYHELFLIKHLPALQLDKNNPVEKLLDLPITLQTSVRLCALSGHFLNFRKEMIAESIEYWQTHDFPILAKDRIYYFILCRSSSLQVVWEEICREEYLLLDFIKDKQTIALACDAIEEMEDVDISMIERHISTWIAKWIANGLLTVEHLSSVHSKTL